MYIWKNLLEITGESGPWFDFNILLSWFPFANDPCFSVPPCSSAGSEVRVLLGMHLDGDRRLWTSGLSSWRRCLRNTRLVAAQRNVERALENRVFHQRRKLEQFKPVSSPINSICSHRQTRVSNPVFTETEKPGNPGFFQNRKTGFWLPVNPVFRFWIFTCSV